ncbi:MAG: protein-disulfide reductase DsbD family protein [Acidobacteriota bacterium]|nr:protein-disulfide reductase DsbD family protein [Acidobacteriota bacterium]
MKRIGLMVFCAICVTSGPGVLGQSSPFGQSASGAVRNDTMHLTVVTSISDTEVAPGQRVSLAFAVTPKKLMHVYAPGKHDYQVIAVKLDPQSWFRVQPTTYPPSEMYHFEVLDEKVETYGKPFKLVQDVTILSTPEAQKLLAASPTVTLSGRLEYQACDDRVCYAPTRVPVSFTLAVKEPDRK